MARTLTAEEYQAEFLIAYANPPCSGTAGVVTLDALIGTDGLVQTLSVHSGDEALTDAALETARHWNFRPLQVNGKPVEVVTEIDVRFQP